jgi:hypothetical protein
VFDLMFLWNWVTSDSATNIYFWCLKSEFHELPSATSVTETLDKIK